MRLDSKSSILGPDSRDGLCGSRVRLVLCSSCRAVYTAGFWVLGSLATQAAEAWFTATAEWIFFTRAGNELKFGGK